MGKSPSNQSAAKRDLGRSWLTPVEVRSLGRGLL